MNKSKREFVEQVWRFYEQSGRHDLPWRQTKDAYRILVSEMMLQQTQVERVVPKYQAFIKQFPDFSALARAPLAEVLILWQGLGYNRRAKLLHECAKAVVSEYGGRLPKSELALRKLPGVGPYTARAVLAFAFDIGIPLIETNVRTVYIQHFFTQETDVTDAQLLPYIEETLDVHKPRHWYYALMDYGSYLKRTVRNNINQSKHYNKQSTFKNSDRQIRGALVRVLANEPQTITRLQKQLTHFDAARIDQQLTRLSAEGLVVKRGRVYSLPT